MVVNNAYGMGTSVERASAEPELFRRAAAYRIKGERVDGDDLTQVIEATEALLDRARLKRRPALLEALTYRHRGHSVADAGLNYRDRAEIDERKGRDPITRLRERLLEAGVAQTELAALAKSAQERVDRAVEFALQSPEPRLGELAAGTYADRSDKQFERMRPASPFGEAELVFEAGLGQPDLALEGGMGI